MRIAFACDHAGFGIRDEVISFLHSKGHRVIDCGAEDYDARDDFPQYAQKVCQQIQEKGAERGILICGTGIGMSMAANRHAGVRAVLAYSPEIAGIGRTHNDANVICFGARTMDLDKILETLAVFLETDFLGGKYQRRNDQIDAL